MNLFLGLSLFVYGSLLAAAEDRGAPGRAIFWNVIHQTEDTNGNTVYRTADFMAPNLGEIVDEMSTGSDVVVLLRKEDSASLVSHPWVSSSVKSSSRSLVMSSVYHPQAKSSAESVQKYIMDSPVMQGASHINVRDLKETLSGPQSSKQKKSYVVTLTGDVSEESDLQLISKLSRKLSILMIVSEEPKGMAPKSYAHYQRVLTTPYTVSKNNTWEGGEYSIYYQGKYLYITPDIFTGSLTGLFFFFVLLIGFNCLSSIQGPGTFATKLPPLGKEG